jgi:Barstar (barnase inhibitor)
VHRIDPVGLDAVAREARAGGVPTFTLSVGGRAGRDGFFDAVRRILPLNPPVETSRSWDALADSMWQGIYELGAARVVIVWPDAAEYGAVSPAERGEALSVLESMTRTLADPRYTLGRPTELCVYVG